MNSIESFLREEGYAYDATFKKNDRYTKDFFRGDSRITVVELVDKFQVVIYDGTTIRRSDHDTELLVVDYLIFQ